MLSIRMIVSIIVPSREHYSPFPPDNASVVYNLFAVSNHTGTPMNGHYTACARNPYSGEWNLFNDSRFVSFQYSFQFILILLSVSMFSPSVIVLQTSGWSSVLDSLPHQWQPLSCWILFRWMLMFCPDIPKNIKIEIIPASSRLLNSSIEWLVIFFGYFGSKFFIIITIYFEDVQFFHARLGLNECLILSLSTHPWILLIQAPDYTIPCPSLTFS